MNQAGRSSSAKRCLRYQATSSVVVTPGVITRLENASAITLRAMLTVCANVSISFWVRVTAHRETPGLGDYIVRSKSPWVEQFVGRSLAAPEAKYWKVAKDGGRFDARAGATITPRAVVKAVKGTLDYYARHRAAILAPPPAEAATPVKEDSA